MGTAGIVRTALAQAQANARKRAAAQDADKRPAYNAKLEALELLLDRKVPVVLSAHRADDIDTGLREARRILVPGGRFVAIERRVRPGATGHGAHGDHGWTDAQADVFATRARELGFDEVRVERNRDGRRETLAVVGTAP